MKTAKQYFKESYDNVSEYATITLPAKNLFRIMDGYAQYKVNELNKSDVIKSACSCMPRDEATNSMGKKYCINFGKIK